METIKNVMAKKKTKKKTVTASKPCVNDTQPETRMARNKYSSIVEGKGTRFINDQGFYSSMFVL